MTKNDLINFIKNNYVEYHWLNDMSDVYICLNYYNLEKFKQILGENILDEEGIYCIFKSGYIVFEMQNICEFFGIKIEDVFENKEN
jgi:hypothetical protein